MLAEESVPASFQFGPPSPQLFDGRAVPQMFNPFSGDLRAAGPPWLAGSHLPIGAIQVAGPAPLQQCTAAQARLAPQPLLHSHTALSPLTMSSCEQTAVFGLAVCPLPTYKACVIQGFGTPPGAFAQAMEPVTGLYPGAAWQGHPPLYNTVAQERALAAPADFTSPQQLAHFVSIRSAPAIPRQHEPAYVLPAGPPTLPFASPSGLGGSQLAADGMHTAAAPRQSGAAHGPAEYLQIEGQVSLRQPGQNDIHSPFHH